MLTSESTVVRESRVLMRGLLGLEVVEDGEESEKTGGDAFYGLLGPLGEQ